MDTQQSRRNIITGVAMGMGFLAATKAQTAFGAESKTSVESKSDNKSNALAAAIADCLRTGEICAGHCSQQMMKGDNTFAKCNAKVQEMMALCKALLTVSSYGSAHTAKLAGIVAEACVECKDACFEHKKHFAMNMHLICKECGEACERCEKACRTV